MRMKVSEEVEKGRELTGPYASKRGERQGRFNLRCPHTGATLRVLVSDGSDWQESGLPPPAWEHVSVSTPNRCPMWSEMSWVKQEFWGDDECVIEFHVPASDHVNKHNWCLHLWRPVGVPIPRPPQTCV